MNPTEPSEYNSSSPTTRLRRLMQQIRNGELSPMNLIDPHFHCISRTTDDYQFMARCGVVAVSEPAFWAGFDRSSASSFADYFHHLTDIEPRRAAKYGIDHYSWLCINAKEAENV